MQQTGEGVKNKVMDDIDSVIINFKELKRLIDIHNEWLLNEVKKQCVK